MELDNLLTKIKKNKETDTPKYLAIEIGLHSIKSAVWEVVSTKPNLVSTGSIEECDPKDPESLLQAADASLSKALAEVDPEPDEVIFSFPEAWVWKNSITKDKKPLVKTLIDKLGLKPIGFVVSIEAIIQHLKLKSGGPFSGILVGTSDEEVQVTISKNGKIIGTQIVGRSDDLGSDVEEALARFDSIDNLPSNIILYDGIADLESQKQELISYDWQARLPFMHLPKITHFEPQETIKAVVIAGGAEVIKSLEVSSSTSKPTPKIVEEEDASDEDLLDDPQDSDETDSKEPIPNLADEFGFSKDPDGNFPPSDNLAPAPSLPLEDPESDESEEEPDLDGTEGDSDDSTDKPSLKSLLSKFSFPKISLPRSSKSPLIILIGIVLLLVLSVSGAFAAYWYLPKADVTIFVEPKLLTTDVTFTLDTNLDSPDLDTLTIPARLATAQSDGSLTAPATGSKTVGEQAAGSIVIYNRSDSPKNLEAGTELIGPDSLTYTLNSDVSLASASAKENPDFSVTIEPKTATAGITATSIGARFNLGSGTEFTIEGYSKTTLVAKADSDISGGSSQEVTAVSQDDIDTLVTELTQKLKNQATQNFNGDNDFAAAIFLEDEDAEIDYQASADVGDTADSVTVEGSFEAEAFTYKKSDFSLLVEHLVKAERADKYEFLQSQSSIDIKKFDQTSDTTLTVVGQGKAKLIPKLDLNNIITQISGRYPSITQDYFRSLPNFSKVAIDIRPKLPQKFNTFPRVPENISITVEVENTDQ